jgi:hypothetical protein
MRLSGPTVRKIAEMICGAHGSGFCGFEWPNFLYRSSSMLTEFFYEYCCLPYQHDGSTRITWVTSVLREVNEGAASNPALPSDDFTRVIRELLETVRLEQPESHQGAIDDLNRVLARDGLRIRVTGGRHVLASTAEQNEWVEAADLKECLEAFTHYVRTNIRMSFWVFDKAINRYTWTPRPEKHAKNLLLTFLNGRFGGSVDTFEEITAGAGKVDVFVVLPSGEKAVVELKMCGHGYSWPYAQAGVEQLAHYMENRSTRTGYLIVFDSRTRDFAKGLRDTESIDGMQVLTSIADVRPYVRLTNAPDDV